MAVLKKELNFTGAPADDDLVFGYQEAWADYKYMPDRYAGFLRPSSQGGNLDYWHYGSEFSGPQTLNASFIKFDHNVIDKTLESTSEWSQQMMLQMDFKLSAIMPMPLYNKPASLTHMF